MYQIYTGWGDIQPTKYKTLEEAHEALKELLPKFQTGEILSRFDVNDFVAGYDLWVNNSIAEYYTGPYFIVLEDGTYAGIGSKVYNYYDRKVVTIGEHSDEGWHTCFNEQGEQCLLNGSRMCSIETAKKKGWV